MYVSIPELGEKLELHTDRVFNSARTIKIPIMALLKDFEEGRLDPTKKQRLAEENRATGSGVLRFMSPDGKSVVMTLMTATTGNTKTIEIFKRVSRAIYDSMI